MVRQNTVARMESRTTAGSFPLIYYVFDFLFKHIPLYAYRGICLKLYFYVLIVLCEISRNEKGFFV